MTANVITYRDRSAVREVARRSASRASRSTGSPSSSAHFRYDLERGDPQAPRTRARAPPASTRRSRATACFGLYWRQIQNLPRHLGQHSGGMVIAAGRLDEVVPLEPAAMPGRVVVQWDKDDCADLGIIKVDLLGLGMLDALEEAIPLIREHERVSVDLAHLPRRRPAGLRDAARRRHGRRLPGREPRADGLAAAQRPDALLRPRRPGRDHPPGADRRRHGAPVLRAPAGARAGDLPAPLPRADPRSARSACRSSRSSSCASPWSRRASPAARPRSCGARWASSARSSAWRRSRRGCARHGGARHHRRQRRTRSSSRSPRSRSTASPSRTPPASRSSPTPPPTSSATTRPRFSSRC